jgi:hypothetical protein
MSRKEVVCLGRFCLLLLMILPSLTQITFPVPQASSGIITLKVGVMFGLGEVRPVARADFYALTKDLNTISKEAAKSLNLPSIEPFEQYINKQSNASAELRAWIIRTNDRGFASRGGRYDFGRVFFDSDARKVTLDDLLNVPEFRNWLQDPANYSESLPKFPKATGNTAKDEKALADYRQRLGTQMIEQDYPGSTRPSWWLIEMIENISKGRANLCYNDEMARRTERIVEAGVLLAPKYSVGNIKTSLSGEAEITLPAGTYWLSNLTGTPIGRSSILWDLPVVVEPGKVTNVRLSNDNAKEID